MCPALAERIRAEPRTSVLRSWIPIPYVIAKMIRLGSMMQIRPATIVGVKEPSVPYPAETQLIANIVTSPHHLSATMAQGREHRMTDLFGRLAPGASLKSARAELRGVYGAMTAAHPDVYKPKNHSRSMPGCSGTGSTWKRYHSLAVAWCLGIAVHHCLLELCKPDSCSDGESRIVAGSSPALVPNRCRAFVDHCSLRPRLLCRSGALAGVLVASRW